MSLVLLDDAGAAFICMEEGFKGGPYWPSGKSGVTIDYGYDLGQVTPVTFEDDWRAVLSDRDYAALLECVGVKGATAGLLARSSSIQGIRIPRGMAISVFQLVTLPRYCGLTEATFPGAGNLLKPVQAALVSLCVNRGGIPTHRAHDASGEEVAYDRYDAERDIAGAVAQGNLPVIAQLLRAMSLDGEGALWQGPTPPNPGLRKRRIQEAELIESTYPLGST